MQMPSIVDSDTSIEVERSENSIVEDSDPDLDDDMVGEKSLISDVNNSDQHLDATLKIVDSGCSGKAIDDFDLSDISVGDGSFHASPSQTEGNMPSERLHSHQQVGRYRRSSSFDQLGISKMRAWLKERLGDPQPDPHVLTDAYIQESMTAFKDGRWRPPKRSPLPRPARSPPAPPTPAGSGPSTTPPPSCSRRSSGAAPTARTAWPPRTWRAPWRPGTCSGPARTASGGRSSTCGACPRAGDELLLLLLVLLKIMITRVPLA